MGRGDGSLTSWELSDRAHCFQRAIFFLVRVLGGFPVLGVESACLGFRLLLIIAHFLHDHQRSCTWLPDREKGADYGRIEPSKSRVMPNLGPMNNWPSESIVRESFLYYRASGNTSRLGSSRDTAGQRTPATGKEPFTAESLGSSLLNIRIPSRGFLDQHPTPSSRQLSDRYGDNPPRCNVGP